MLAAGKRRDGRWAYGESPESEISYARRGELGVIADHAPELLIDVRDDTTTLNAAHEHAKSIRDAERQQMEKEQRQAREEASRNARASLCWR